MALDLLLTLAGLGIVLLGGYLLVQGAVTIAIGYGLPRAVVGATVVAFGTSAPEFVVGISAVVRGADGISVGNVIGACIGNVGLVLGLAAVVNPGVLFTRLRRAAVPALFGAVGLFLLVAAGGAIQRWEGVVLLLALLAFAGSAPRLFPELVATPEARTAEVRPRVTLREWAQVAGAVVALGAGAQVALDGALSVARDVGLSEVAVGVVIVSLGTTLPEGATSLMAALRDEYEIAVSNVLGSNIINLLGVMGTVAVVGVVDVDPGVFRLEAPALVISAAALVPFALGPRRYRITRLEGAILLFLYAAFLALVVDRGL